MRIREATPEDNVELQGLQARSPQGTQLITSVVNTPDFFARVKAYESYRVFVACEDNRIIGSTACALRKALVNGKLSPVGYSFQTFTSPSHRRKHLAKRLLQHMEDHLIQNGAVLVYGLIMERNLPSIKLIESLGWRLHRTLVMPALAVFEEMDIESIGTVRPIRSEDLATVAELLNETWQGFELYEPYSADRLARFINRTPAYSFENLLVLEDQGELVACLGCWDWSRLIRITVQKLSMKMRMLGLLLPIARMFRPLPPFVKPGDTLKQMMLTPIGFKDSAYVPVLLRYVNNQALRRDIRQLCCLCERDHVLLRNLKGFLRVDKAQNLYIKTLQENVTIANKPVFIDAIDL